MQDQAQAGPEGTGRLRDQVAEMLTATIARDSSRVMSSAHNMLAKEGRTQACDTDGPSQYASAITIPV